MSQHISSARDEQKFSEKNDVVQFEHENIVLDKDAVVKVEEEGNIHQLPADEVQRLADLLDSARRATESEHKMTVWQAIKRYPRATAWSVAISFGVVMEGQWALVPRA